jgi:cytochrome c-type biogenesis protein CcmF
MVTWLFQSIGILLGAGWAYAVLGWGGYWGWDPVENASLLPWITATAFLHSVMMQEKKGMMKVWNMVLISATFFLCIFGTFLTRSGIGEFGARLRAVADRPTSWFPGDRHRAHDVPDSEPPGLPEERSATGERGVARVELPVQQPDPAGKLLRGAVGHAVPGDQEAVTGEKISVGAPFFNKVNVPIGLFLLLLTGVGPLIAWRRTSMESLKKNVPGPAIGCAARRRV